ncbi:ACP synthase [Halovenus sp. WSH3]|uniref:ACP synthase n=1 Tax=Halovenus carboxidivorans TaxID=2692199 RepID=A0A6B0T6G9_9EURY|nr:zinc ribbon domain-containing protein [Halovenus carboxidivorans]MXR51786.1 ACP synthase [Halovenus carboxidivorans]
MTGIDQIGTYVPRYALAAEAVEEAWGQFHGAGIEHTAVPGGDEDTLTMAYEAATNAIEAGDLDHTAFESLLVATTTPPLEEEPMGARLRSTLGLDDSIRTRQLTGSTRAGVEALVTAAERSGPTLVVASDSPRGAPDSDLEQAGGAGAVALVVTDDGTAEMTDHAARVDAVPGTRFRPAGSDESDGLGIATYDRNAYTSAVGGVAADLDTDPSEFAAVALQAPNGKLPYRAAGALGVETETIAAGTNVSEIGDTGAASPLFGLATAQSAASTLVVGYGSGDAAAVAIEGSIPVATNPHDGIVPEDRRSLNYGEYLRMRGEITTGEPEGGGAYVSVPSWKRTMPQRHRLVAGRCTECGTLAFPPEGACTDCGTFESYESVELPGTGTVEAATEIGAGGAPPEFVEQQAKSGAYTSAVVALDGPDGGSVSIPAQVLGDGETTVGDRVTATIRRIYTQEDVIRYGFKMRPLAED